MDDISRDMRADVGIPLSAKLITRPQASAQVYRAMLIARTEAMRLTNDMQKRAWGENQNFMTERVWRTAPGFLGVCDDCAELDGVSSEDLDGEEPPLHPNCRCMMTMVPKPFQELYGGAFDEPIDQYEMKVASPTTGNPVAVSVQPYDEWMNS